jgi:hypothetical protein
MKLVIAILLVAMCVGHFGCASNGMTSSNTNSAQQASSSPAPSSGSSGIADALIVFEQSKPPITIDSLLAALQKRLPYNCSRTQWVGFTMTIPQIRIDAPTPIFLQINDDPEYVPAETKELVTDAKVTFGPLIAAKIARCRVRLEVMGPETNPPQVKEKSIEVIATSTLDPSVAPVKDVLKVVADTVHGYVFDEVNGKWQYAAP